MDYKYKHRSKSVVSDKKINRMSISSNGSQFHFKMDLSKSIQNKNSFHNNMKNSDYTRVRQGEESKTYSSMLKSKLRHRQADNSPNSNKINFGSPISVRNKNLSLSRLSPINKIESKKYIEGIKLTNSVSNLFGVNNKTEILDLDVNSKEQNILLTQNLKRIFDYYCQYGDRMNQGFLKSNKFQKFALDAELLDAKFTKNNLEVIFSFQNKHKALMDFETFLDTLPKIAEIKYFNNNKLFTNNDSKLKSNKSLQLLLKSHILPLYEALFELGNEVRESKTTNKSSILSPNADKNKKKFQENSCFKNKNFSVKDNSITISNNSELILEKELHKVKNSDLNNHDLTSIIQPSMYNNKNEIDRASSKLKKCSSLNSLASSFFEIGMINSPINRETSILKNDVPDIDIILENSQDAKDLIKSVTPTFYEIYKAYFPTEISNTENTSYVKENTTKGYFSLLKDFDIYPQLINKSTAFKIFQSEIIDFSSEIVFNSSFNFNACQLEVIKNIQAHNSGRFLINLIGRYFTFFKFLNVICKIAYYCFKEEYSEWKEGSLSYFEKFCLLLERMQLSNGLEKLIGRVNNPINKKITCLISNKILIGVKEGIKMRMNEDYKWLDGSFKEKFNFKTSIDEAKDLKTNDDLYGKMRRSIKMRKTLAGDLENLKEIFENSDFILQHYGNDLNIIFKYYTSFGDPSNFSNLKAGKFTKFLKESGLIKTNVGNSRSVDKTMNLVNSASASSLQSGRFLDVQQVELIFFKVAALSLAESHHIRNNSFISPTQSTTSIVSDSLLNYKKAIILQSNNKVDFNGFIKLIEVISLLLMPESTEKEGIKHIIETKIFSFFTKNERSKENVRTVNPSNVSEVRDVMVQILLPFYNCYQDKNSLINFDLFLKFCNDFDIFPSLVSKTKLNFYFKNSLKDQIPGSSGLNLYDEVTHIDFEAFVDVLINCACEIACYFENEEVCYERIIIKKIIFLLENIIVSYSVKKTFSKFVKVKFLKNKIDLFSILRKNFPWNYEKKKEEHKFFTVLNHKEKAMEKKI